jgi:hypothetical protein
MFQEFSQQMYDPRDSEKTTEMSISQEKPTASKQSSPRYKRRGQSRLKELEKEQAFQLQLEMRDLAKMPRKLQESDHKPS